MANIPASTPFQDEHVDYFIPLGGGPIRADQKPTPEEIAIAVEMHRLRKLISKLLLFDASNSLTDEELSDAVLRYHKMLSQSGTIEIMAQLQQVPTTMNEGFTKMEARIQQIESKLEKLEGSSEKTS